MSLIRQLAEKYKMVSIVGMAKNAGKTTTLNYLIDQAMDWDVSLGVTSTGRDGETVDLVTGTEKPRVFADAGTIVSVPVQLYDLAQAGMEILRMTRYSTALGQMMLCRVAESGYVQIAGPPATADLRALCLEMLGLGAELVLIDGAIDRRAIADPTASDAIILATGAVLSRRMDKVVEQTLHVTELFRLPELPPGELRGKMEDALAADRIAILKKDGLHFPAMSTGLAGSKFLDEAIDDDTRCVYLPGALTLSVVSDIHPAKLKKVLFVLKDPTRIFIDPKTWRTLRKKGFQLRVLKNIEIAAVSVNPYSPAGYSFDHEALLNAMQEALPQIPVIDVKAPRGTSV
ncbi:MAG: hypothetical protein Q4C22_02565 [Bacillota bacterium]|nr:hypothetical protein [Bacillota bacterium]